MLLFVQCHFIPSGLYPFAATNHCMRVYWQVLVYRGTLLGLLMSLQQLKKGVVTLTVRTRLRSPSLTPCVTPTLLSRSSSPSSSASGGMPVPSPDEADGSSSSRKGPGPKDRIVMDVTLNKGEGPLKWARSTKSLLFSGVFGNGLATLMSGHLPVSI